MPERGYFNMTAPKKSDKARAGHYEIQGETIAKFEFFDHGWNPYSKYLDVDKVDLIVRRRTDAGILYREVQVKFGRLYDCTRKWERPLFDVTSWRIFGPSSFAGADEDLIICYVLARPGRYEGDMFLFPLRTFEDLIHMSIPVATKGGGQFKVYISRSTKDSKWYLRKKERFDTLSEETVLCVHEFRQNFGLLETP